MNAWRLLGRGEPVIRPPAHGHGRLDWWTEALILALAVAEAAVVWLIADIVLASSEGDRPAGVPPLVVFLLIYAAVAMPRWLEAFDVWDPWFQAALAATIAATTLVAIKLASYPGVAWIDTAWVRDAVQAVIARPNEAVIPVWGMIVLSAYAWWRSRRRHDPEMETAHTLLRLGTIATVVTVVIRAAAVPDQEHAGAARAVLVFFAGTLSAIAIARMRQERGRAETVGAGWLPAFLGPVGAIAVIALVAVGLFSRDVLDTLLWILSPLVWALTVILRLFVLLIALIAFIIVSPILWLLSGHTFDLAGVRISPSPVGLNTVVDRGTDHASRVPDPLRYVFALAILTLLFSTATRLVLRHRRRRRPPADEERETLLDAGDLLHALGNRLRRLMRRGPRAVDALDALRGDSRWAHSVEIRETYRRFLIWSRDQHVARDAPSTPLEHAATLAPLVPRDRDDLATLTARYNAARYGDRPATSADAAAARTAWRRLRRAPDRG
ncbi:MAG: DUF4129 domain-containing protein [Thermomicrobiales bacterium]